jgi:septal ring-binding cell division protein DamX
MSLESALEANTAAVRELIRVLHEGPLSGSVIAKEELTEKKPDTVPTAPATSAPSGEPSAPTPGKSSAAPEPTVLQPWAEACADTYASLKDGDASLDNIKTAILAINSKIDRAQANAVLGRFGAQAVTAKADKRGLDPEQYEGFFRLCLDVLSGRVDATASLPTEA